jgi:uncharacterized membrane protein
METDNNQNQPTSPSVTAFISWMLAGLIGFIGIFQLLDEKATLYHIIALIGSSLTLLWMGHVVNYLKQISDKK